MDSGGRKPLASGKKNGQFSQTPLRTAGLAGMERTIVFPDSPAHHVACWDHENTDQGKERKHEKPANCFHSLYMDVFLLFICISVKIVLRFLLPFKASSRQEASNAPFIADEFKGKSHSFNNHFMNERNHWMAIFLPFCCGC